MTTRVLIDARLAVRGLGIATYVERLLAGLGDDRSLLIRRWGASGEWGRRAKLATLARSGLFDVSPRLDPRARSFDVVHYASNLAPVVPGRTSVVTVYDLLHRRPGTSRRDRVAGALVERSLSRTGRVAAISDRTRVEVERAFPSLVGRVEVIPPGMRRLPPSSRPRSHVLGFGGGSDPRKRTDLMISVYQRYRATTPHALPLVVLSRAGLTRPQEAALATLAARVVPSATRAEVDALMAGAAAVLYPTVQEGLGLPILEAAEAGTPVVMDRDADVATEVIGAHCIRVIGADLDAWVEGLRRAVATAPVDRPLDLEDWSAVASRYRALYAEVRAG